MTNVAEPGSIFAGKYKVEKLIGSGGMGVILSATHMQLEQRVAIKLLTTDAALDPDRVGRFSREAKAAARIQCEHVVRILDYGTHPSGAPFIVMEHLEGIDLAMAVKTRGQLPIDEAIDYMIQACDGVGEAHLAGIIHRDLKPANLFLTRKKDGVATIKVLDFGASKLTAECSLAASDMSKTNASSLIGSPRYMAPEQLKSANEIDSRADIYALGATLFELLAGKPVFAAESISRIFTKILWDAPPSINEFRDDVPPDLDALLFKTLEKRPEDRYQTVQELVAALAAFAPSRSAALVRQISGIGLPHASIAPPPTQRVYKRDPSFTDEAPPAAPARAPRAPEAGSATDGSASLNTMQVLQAARSQNKRRDVGVIASIALAVVAAVVAVYAFALRPKPQVAEPAAASSTTAAPTFSSERAPVPLTQVVPVPKLEPVLDPAPDAGARSTAASATRPRPSDRVSAARPGVPATTAVVAPVVPPPPVEKPGEFSEFGKRK